MSRYYSSTMRGMEQQSRRFGGTFGRNLSGGFRKAIQTVDQLRRGLSGLPSRIGLNVDYSSVRQARQEVERLRDAQGRLRDSRGRFVGEGGSSSGGGWLKGLGFAGLGMGGLLGGYLGWQGVKAAYGQTISPAMEMERNRFSAGIMLHSQERSSALDAQYQAYAKQNPVLGYKDIQSAGTQMVGLEERYDRIMPIIKTMSDVAVGSQNELKDLILILGQVKMKGRLQAEEGLQFAERRVNLMPYLAKAIGKKQTDLPDLMKDGKISYENVLRALSMMTAKGGVYNGMSEKVGDQTTYGKTQKLWEDLSLRAANLGDKMLPTLNKLLVWMDDFLRRAEGPFAKALAFAGVQLGVFAGGMKDVFVALGIISKEGTATEGVIKVLAGTIGALGVAAKITGDFLSGFAAFVDQVMGLFRSIFNFPRDPIGALTGKYWNGQDSAPEAAKAVETPEEKFRRQGRLFSRTPENPDFDPGYMKRLAESNAKLSEGNRAYAQQQQRLAKLDSRRQARRLRLGEKAVDTTGLLGSGELQTAKGKKGASDSGLEATVAGSKSTNITINLKSLIDGGVHIHSTELKEGVAEVRDMLIDHFTRVINSATAIPS
ncbi:tape measure protein [Spirosoma aerolatum]|uniref:tape measure protein n=1 Tax=Spirosoma aerolatum TaxID=1211326 RepID=UPI0012D2BBCA|nr:tape measure protein [Spirosoma aerolatum]